MPSIAYTIDIHEDAWFALHLNGTHQALPEGDFKIVADDKVWLVERKTWGDAYSSFRSKRLEDQLSRMLLATPKSIQRTANKSRIFKQPSIGFQRKYALWSILTERKIP